VLRSTAVLASLALLFAACSSTPQPATPAPAAAVTPGAAPTAAPAPAPAAAAQPTAQATLAGDWDVEIASAQRGTLTSQMRLVPRGNGYVGVAQPIVDARGELALPTMGPTPIQVRSATVTGSQATIVLDFEGDEGRIIANLRGPNRLDGSISSRSISGRVTLQRR
jgi:hypothetical protein